MGENTGEPIGADEMRVAVETFVTGKDPREVQVTIREEISLVQWLAGVPLGSVPGHVEEIEGGTIVKSSELTREDLATAVRDMGYTVIG